MKKTSKKNSKLKQHKLSPTDQALFKTFQANLLSLISHELKTPLTGMLNSLALLEEDGASGEFSASELISMARRNALRLNQTLSELLDLAAIDSETFQLRLREVHLGRLVRACMRSGERLLRDRSVGFSVHSEEEEKSDSPTQPVLADPQRLARAIDLVLQMLSARVEPSSEINIRVGKRSIDFTFQMSDASISKWRTNWEDARTNSTGLDPASAFRGTIGSEKEFLTRSEEGIGAEPFLIYEIMKKHMGDVSIGEVDDQHQVVLTLPELTSREAIREIIGSRAAHSVTSLGTVALGFIECPGETKLSDFGTQMRKCLFRATDAVYVLPDENRVALVMDDCKKEDVPRLISRVQQTIGLPLKIGVVICPDEGSDAELLISLAEKRLRS